MAAGLSACQKENRNTSSTPPDVTGPPAHVAEIQAVPSGIKPIPDFVDLGPNVDDGETWLKVRAIRKGAKGAWATGSFDRKRNKLTIETEGVERFVVDSSQVAIDWQRLVIIRIDGDSSELRHRDSTVYRFARDRHGAWIVRDP